MKIIPIASGLLLTLTTALHADIIINTQIPKPISEIIQEASDQYTIIPIEIRRHIAERCASVKFLYAITQENTGYSDGRENNTESFNHQVGIYFYVQLSQDRLNQRLIEGEELSEELIKNTGNSVFNRVLETTDRYRNRIASGETAISDSLVNGDSETCTGLFFSQTG